MKCDWVKKEQSNSPQGRAGPAPSTLPRARHGILLFSSYPPVTTVLVQVPLEMVGTAKGFNEGGIFAEVGRTRRESGWGELGRDSGASPSHSPPPNPHLPWGIGTVRRGEGPLPLSLKGAVTAR